MLAGASPNLTNLIGLFEVEALHLLELDHQVGILVQVNKNDNPWSNTFIDQSADSSLFIDPNFIMFAIFNIFHQNDYNASQYLVILSNTFIDQSADSSLFIDPNFIMFAIFNIFHQNDYNASQ